MYDHRNRNNLERRYDNMMKDLAAFAKGYLIGMGIVILLIIFWISSLVNG